MSSLPIFMSRLVIPAGTQYSQANRDLHGVHDTLWQGFRQLSRVAPRPFLFRADRHAGSGDGSAACATWKVLVQSTVQADWTKVAAQDVQQKQVEVAFMADDVLRFFLRANPVMSVKGKLEPRFAGLDAESFRAKRGLKVAVRGEEALGTWLNDQALRHGFAVNAVRIMRHHRESWRAKSSGNGHAVHEGVDFEGHLRVVEPHRLLPALAAGIGRGRGFGFGLLSLARERG